MAHDVFISYATEDKRTADAVCARLEQQNIRCWIAPRDLRPGSLWQEGIVEAIHQAQTLVLVFSAYANESPDVAREVSQAVRRGLSVITFRIEDVAPSGALDYNLNGLHWLDAMTAPLERHIDRLVATLRPTVTRPADTTLPGAATVRGRASPRARPIRGQWMRALALGTVLGVASVAVYLSLGPSALPPADLGGLPPSAAPALPAASASPSAAGSEGPPATVDAAALSQMKIQAASHLQLMCDGLFCRVPSLREGRLAVRAILIGEVASRLDRHITLRQGAAGPDAARFEVQNLPYRPGGEMYVQLEFVDGTHSEVRPAEFSGRADDSQPAIGVRLAPSDSTGGSDAPLFISYVTPYDRLQMIPDNSRAASVVWYSLDEGPYQRAYGRGTGMTAFQFDAPVANAVIRLRTVAADGSESGPLVYHFSDAARLVTQAARRRAATLKNPRAHPPITCARVSLTWPLPSSESVPEGSRARAGADLARATRLLDSAGLSFLDRAPAVACVAAPLRAGRSGPGAGLGDWSVIRAVRIRTDPGGTVAAVPVDSPWHGTLAAREVPRGREFVVWRTVLPVAVQSIAAQFLLDDGSETAPLAVPLREIR